MDGLILQFYAGRDNVEDVVLLAGKTPINATVLTRARLEIEDPADPTDAPLFVLDSDVDEGLFEWPVTIATGQYANAKALRIKLSAADLPAGEYAARLVTYDADNLNGIVWGSRLLIRMDA